MRIDELNQMNQELSEAVQAVQDGWIPPEPSAQERKQAQEAIAFLDAYEASYREAAMK